MLVDVVMPQMGTSIVEGTLIEWSKSVGDRIEAEETICEISTDKIDTECPSPVSGAIAELLIEVGDTVSVGEPIARIAVGQESARRPRTSPVASRIAAAAGIDLSTIKGTGRGGRVTKRDALAAAARGADVGQPEPPMHSDSPYQPGPAPTASATVVVSATDLGGVTTKLSRIRQSIGAAMLRSQSVAATCHTLVECDMTTVQRRRHELGITALPLVADAVVRTLASFPNLNATLDETMLTRYERVHLGIAVSLGDDGLIVPVIRDAENLSPQGLSAAIQDLAARARSKQLTPDDVGGATFTITNPGAYGAMLATPVIDLPQVGILDLEAIVRRPVVVSDTDGGESIAIRPMVNLILGWDHRAMDGVYAARFLSALRARLEGAQ